MTSSDANRVSPDALDDRTVLLVLSHATQSIREDLTVERLSEVSSQGDALAAIASLSRIAIEGALDPQGSMASVADAARSGRQLLQEMVRDPATQELTAELLEQPPDQSQLFVESAAAAAVVVGAVIAWLQTKLKFRVTRRDGRTEVQFELLKDSADTRTISAIAKTVADLFTSNSGPTQ